MTAPAAAPQSLDWEHVLAFRLRRHLLDRPATGLDAAAAAVRLGGLHAQVASCAELSAVLRSADLTPSAVQGAVADSRLIKTWMMRGTLHYFAAEQYPLFVAAGRTRRGHLGASWLKYQGVTREQLEAVIAVVPALLKDRVLTRTELAGEVAAELADPELARRLESGWGDLFKPSAYRGDLCFGPPRGRNVTFALPSDQLAGAAWTERSPDEAIVEVARRFVAVYGPITREDFGRWWGIQPAEAGRVLARVEGLAPVDVEGHRALALEADLDELAGRAEAPEPDPVRLVPGFDPYVLAAAPRAHERIVPDGAKDLVYRAQGWISPVALHRGRMVAVWRHELRGRRLAVAFTPLAPVAEAVRAAFAAETGRLAAALGAADVDAAWTD